MGLQGILFYFIAALFYFILFYMCGRLNVIKLYTKFECSRSIRGGVMAISIFDLMTLNAV